MHTVACYCQYPEPCGHVWTPGLLVMLLQRAPALRSLAFDGCRALVLGTPSRPRVSCACMLSQLTMAPALVLIEDAARLHGRSPCLGRVPQTVRSPAVA